MPTRWGTNIGDPWRIVLEYRPLPTFISKVLLKHNHTYAYSMATFTYQQHHWAAATEPVWHTKDKILVSEFLKSYCDRKQTKYKQDHKQYRKASHVLLKFPPFLVALANLKYISHSHINNKECNIN